MTQMATIFIFSNDSLLLIALLLIAYYYLLPDDINRQVRKGCAKKRKVFSFFTNSSPSLRTTHFSPAFMLLPVALRFGKKKNPVRTGFCLLNQ